MRDIKRNCNTYLNLEIYSDVKALPHCDIRRIKYFTKLRVNKLLWYTEVYSVVKLCHQENIDMILKYYLKSMLWSICLLVMIL